MPFWVSQKVSHTKSSQKTCDWINAFLKPFQKSRTHNSSFWPSGLWAHRLCRPDKCDPERVLFFFLSSFLFSVSRISGVGQSVSSVQSLKKTLRCISVSQPPSRCTLFSLNNMLVKCISTPQPLFFPPSLPPHMAVCRQTTQCCECRHSAPG